MKLKSIYYKASFFSLEGGDFKTFVGALNGLIRANPLYEQIEIQIEVGEETENSILELYYEDIDESNFTHQRIYHRAMIDFNALIGKAHSVHNEIERIEEYKDKILKETFSEKPSTDGMIPF